MTAVPIAGGGTSCGQAGGDGGSNGQDGKSAGASGGKGRPAKRFVAVDPTFFEDT